MRIHHFGNLLDGGNEICPLFGFEIIELSFELVMQKARQVRCDLRALLRQPGMYDSPVRDGSVSLNEALFFQFIENGHNRCRTQIGIV